MKSHAKLTLTNLAVLKLIFDMDSAKAAYPQCTSTIPCHEGETCVLQGQPQASVGVGLCQPTVVASGGYCGTNIMGNTSSVINIPLTCGAGYICDTSSVCSMVSDKLNLCRLF